MQSRLANMGTKLWSTEEETQGRQWALVLENAPDSRQYDRLPAQEQSVRTTGMPLKAQGCTISDREIAEECERRSGAKEDKTDCTQE